MANEANEKVNILFGKRLRELREEKGLLQEDVGIWFNMRKSTVSQWENGRLPHATIIAELAKKFNVTTDYLLGLSVVKHITETIAAHRIDDPTDELPPEAVKSIEDFKAYIRAKYCKKPTTK